MLTDSLWESTPMDTCIQTRDLLVNRWGCDAGSATTSWAVPSGATPRHGTRRETQTDREPHPSAGWAAARRASPRTPEPSLARHRFYRESAYGERRVGAF